VTDERVQARTKVATWSNPHERIDQQHAEVTSSNPPRNPTPSIEEVEVGSREVVRRQEFDVADCLRQL
jgi:hypothetical protein